MSEVKDTEARLRSVLETAALKAPGSTQVSVWRSNDGWSVNWFDGNRRHAKVEIYGHTGSNTSAVLAALRVLAGESPPAPDGELRAKLERLEFSKENAQAAEYVAKLADAIIKAMGSERINLRVPNEDFAVAMAAVMRNRGHKATHSSGPLFDRDKGKLTNQVAHAVYISPKRKAKPL